MNIENILNVYLFVAPLLRRRFADLFSIYDRIDVAFVERKSGQLDFFGATIQYSVHGTGVKFLIHDQLEIDIEDNIHQDFFLSYWSFYNFCLNFDQSYSFELVKDFIKSIKPQYKVASVSHNGILLTMET